MIFRVSAQVMTRKTSCGYGIRIFPQEKVFVIMRADQNRNVMLWGIFHDFASAGPPA